MNFTESITTNGGDSFHKNSIDPLSYEHFEKAIKKEHIDSLVKAADKSSKGSITPPEVEFPGADDIFMQEEEDETVDMY